ncbi:non-homologous end-joining DNA ligase [Mucilaginibacter aquariorum]|uniref:Non-homologous end-joining DNA ligase n=1 Tax=Mucilaginibacter aquariorum TaxID=2967225 RepID=A0ABT1TBD7_9SPHI|nr:non-homologous end-joining DNA ligase [Mucilaginibacter aquariorum]MCQ6961581.1 non-homologous end-joining DNA ligase [Mucilaginibacter aquariorum]
MVVVMSKMLLNKGDETQVRVVDQHQLTFSHLDKLYWPDDGLAKRDLINYYDQVASYMLPYLKGRPVTLHRFPDGITGGHFYQKDVSGILPEWAESFEHTTEVGELQHYLVANDEAALLWMAGLGCIEINPWCSRITSPDHPDYCVLDLDPGGNSFSKVIQVALVIKATLNGLGVSAYPKTSGLTGLHIYIPLGAKYSFDQSAQLARHILTVAHQQTSGYTTMERMIHKRQGKLYLDYLQNRFAATVAAPYSLRPKPGAPVSMPLSWEEIKPGLNIRNFTIQNAPQRLRATGDLFKGVLGEGVDLLRILRQ